MILSASLTWNIRIDYLPPKLEAQGWGRSDSLQWRLVDFCGLDLRALEGLLCSSTAPSHACPEKLRADLKVGPIWRENCGCQVIKEMVHRLIGRTITYRRNEGFFLTEFLLIKRTIKFKECDFFKNNQNLEKLDSYNLRWLSMSMASSAQTWPYFTIVIFQSMKRLLIIWALVWKK